jgi:HSP20 family molecular chaperone IbpA
LALPEDIDPDSAAARYSNGVLQISLKRKAEATPRKIEIN